MSLIQLPNGSWIAPSAITSISPIPAKNEGNAGITPACVIVCHGDYVETLIAKNNQAAIALADALAAQVNAAGTTPAGA